MFGRVRQCGAEACRSPQREADAYPVRGQTRVRIIFRDLFRYREGFIQGNGPTCDPVREGWPFHQLQHQGPRALGFLDAVDGGNARVVEAGENLSFSLEPGQAIRIGGEGFGEDLERHLAVELGVDGLIDLSHAAFADEGGYVVMAESGADGQGHVRVCVDGTR